MPVKRLIRKQEIRFNVVPMVKRNLLPHQDRASFINMLVTQQGKTYQDAIRAFDSMRKVK